MILFQGEGPALFRDGLEKAMEDPLSSRKWYLSVIRDLCPTLKVWTSSIESLRSCEVDYPADLKSAEHVVSACAGEKGNAPECR